MIPSLCASRNFTPANDGPDLHFSGQDAGADRRKSLNGIPDSERDDHPSVRSTPPQNPHSLDAAPQPFTLSQYTKLFFDNKKKNQTKSKDNFHFWKPEPHFKSHDPKTRFAMLGLAAAFGSHRPDMALTVNLRDGETTKEFIDKLQRAVRRAGGRKLTYFGVAASLPWQHLHLVLSLPSGSPEHATVQAFLIRRDKEYLDGCTRRDGKSPEWHLRRGGGKAEPMKPVHFNCLTDAMRGYNCLPGYTRYLAHHIRDAERSGCPEQYPIEIVASDEIRALAREIGRHPPEALAEVIQREGLDLPGLLEIDGPMLARVVSKRKPDLPLEKATRRVLEGYIDHIRANRIPVVMPPALIPPLRMPARVIS